MITISRRIESLNSIPEDQLSDTQLERLAAQRQAYSDAKGYFAVSLLLAGPVAAVVSVISVLLPSARPYALLWSLTIAIADTGLLVPRQRALSETGAKIQELFDCSLFHIEWSQLKAGSKPDYEIIHSLAGRYKRRAPSLQAMRDWYPKEVGALPLHIARVLCQRTNSWWDAQLRERYTSLLLASFSVLVLFVILVGLVAELSLGTTLTVIAGPVFPALVLISRLYREQQAATLNAIRLKTHADSLWHRILGGTVTENDLELETRRLQDEIFDHRRRSPLVFDWVYHLRKTSYQNVTTSSASKMVEEFQDSQIR